MGRRRTVRKCLVTLFVALIAFSAIAGELEQREIIMSEQAVLSALVTASHREGKYLCTQHPIACLGPNSSELGLALIASRDTKSSLSSLASLVRYRMDAGLSEGYTCYVLSKGRKITDYLSGLNTNALQNTCKDELVRMGKAARGLIDGVEITTICSNANQINERVQSLIEAIAAGRQCSPEDY